MQLLLVCTCMGVHRKEVKLKEAVRLQGLSTISTKERGFGFQGVNCGDVTRKYMGTLMDGEDHFIKVCLGKLILVPTPICDANYYSSLWYGGAGDTFPNGKCMSCFPVEVEKGRAENFLSQCPPLKTCSSCQHDILGGIP